jgi:hypothetical protein
MADDKDSELKLFFPYIEEYNDKCKLSYFLTSKGDSKINNYYKFTINNYNLFIYDRCVFIKYAVKINNYIPVKLHTTVLYFPENIFNTDFDNKEIYLERILPNYSQFTVHTFDGTDRIPVSVVKTLPIQASTSSALISQTGPVQLASSQSKTSVSLQNQFIKSDNPPSLSTSTSALSAKVPVSTQQIQASVPVTLPTDALESSNTAIDKFNMVIDKNMKIIDDVKLTYDQKNMFKNLANNTVYEDIKINTDSEFNNVDNISIDKIIEEIKKSSQIIKNISIQMCAFKTIVYYFFSKEYGGVTDTLIFYCDKLKDTRITNISTSVTNILTSLRLQNIKEYIIFNTENINVNINITLLIKLINIIYFAFNKINGIFKDNELNNLYDDISYSMGLLIQLFDVITVKLDEKSIKVSTTAHLDINKNIEIVNMLKYIFTKNYNGNDKDNILSLLDSNYLIDSNWLTKYDNLIKNIYICNDDDKIISLRNYFTILLNKYDASNQLTLASSEIQPPISLASSSKISAQSLSQVSSISESVSQTSSSVSEQSILASSEISGPRTSESLSSSSTVIRTPSKFDASFAGSDNNPLTEKQLKLFIQATKVNLQEYNHDIIFDINIDIDTLITTINGISGNFIVNKVIDIFNIIFYYYFYKELDSADRANDKIIFYNCLVNEHANNIIYNNFIIKDLSFAKIAINRSKLNSINDEAGYGPYSIGQINFNITLFYKVVDICYFAFNKMFDIIQKNDENYIKLYSELYKLKSYVEQFELPKIKHDVEIIPNNIYIDDNDIYLTIKYIINKYNTGNVFDGIQQILNHNFPVIFENDWVNNNKDFIKRFYICFKNELINLYDYFYSQSLVNQFNPNSEGGSIHSLVKNMLGGSLSDEKIIRKLNNETIRNKIKSYYELNSKKILSKDKDYYNKLHKLYLSL